MGTLNRPVRVLFVIDELATAGTETQLLALIGQVDRQRVQPALVLLRGESLASQALEPRDCPVLRLGVGRLRDPQTALRGWQFLRFVWEFRPDVVQTYFPDSSYFAVPLARVAGVPHVVRTRNNIGHWVRRMDRWLGRMLNPLVSATIANCHAARDVLLRDERPHPARVHVLENGVDLDRFLTIAPPAGPARTVGGVANLRPIKGLDVLVQAACQLPGLRFHIAGEGEQRAQLQQTIEAHRLPFSLPGACRDIPGFLSTIDIAVSCSRAEGLSNAILEYMAAARPIVATAVGATPELIRHGQEGLLVASDNPSELAQAIAYLRDHFPLARAMGLAARRRAIQHYSRQSMIRRFEAFYARLVQGRTNTHETAA
jgi:glycosyltransferase involved in cell wall biosynthesis